MEKETEPEKEELYRELLLQVDAATTSPYVREAARRAALIGQMPYTPPPLDEDFDKAKSNSAQAWLLVAMLSAVATGVGLLWLVLHEVGLA